MNDRQKQKSTGSALPAAKRKDRHIIELTSEVAYRTRLQKICNKINAAANLDEILIDLKDDITSLFEAERITVYVVDENKHQLVSRFKSGNDIEEIRIPISANSIAGWCAVKNTVINIKDAYNSKELARIDPKLRFDDRWDLKTGFRTRQILARPIGFRNQLLGVIQLMNRKTGMSFVQVDEKSLEEVAGILGIALQTQKKLRERYTMGKFDFLLENHLLTHQELEKGIVLAREKQMPIETVLMSDIRISKRDILSALAKYYDTEAVEFTQDMMIPGKLLTGLKMPFMRTNSWVPLREEDSTLVIAIDNPHDQQRIGEINSLFPGKELKFCVALKRDVLEMINFFFRDAQQQGGIEEILSVMQEESEEIEEVENAVDEEDSMVVKLVNKIILDAHARGASDIHIEPFPDKENTQVRTRIDGDCVVYQTIPFSYRNAVVSRIKIMSDLDIAERRKPQDGKIKFKNSDGQDIELRVATLPTQGGVEDVVLRLLDAGEPLPLNKIGFTKRNYDNFTHAISTPYGIVFVCGPTGSGKTTTLHSALKYLNKPETKIWTAEDPVEITQKGLRQVQVKPKIGFDFAAAMRSFLRADPDVIMVGEMRDRETASIGIQASLTGHLVLSTLHTNSAPESITRLLDMGMDPFNFSDAILCVLAQRLARTLCKDCKRPYHPSAEEYTSLVREYGPNSFDENVNIRYADELMLNRPVGCRNCNNKGYRGRMALHELLMGTDEIKLLVQNRAKVDVIRSQAVKDGMMTLKQDGIEKIFAGPLELQQVRKVCIR
ncbi:MAG: GspE/PulE family protein [Deltaproteobacteria bacterium]|jgi:type II secretory ATPase GspE/PulE/Tfp pilus assembly ATPase PilB-like protein|nr:GspE/PulE family protein [Deltaproteobacteria bacterium]